MEIFLNNINNKEKFFAQYYGQNIVCDGLSEGDTCTVEYALSESIYVEAWLELKPLSAITDEDAIEVGRLNGSITSDNRLVGHALVHWLHKEGTSRDIPFEAVDYLRSKGYALPYMGLSVEEQVSRGWVKLVGIPEGLYIDKNTLK